MNEHISKWYESYETNVRKLMHDIWEHPEFAMEEQFAASESEKFLKMQGFETKTFHAKEPENCNAAPNTVYARWGFGKPVIGILGELDSLKGLGNEDVPYYSPKPGCGHGCGHNLMAGCGVAAASALRYAMEKENVSGTIIYIGCPAEETLEGKVWLAKWGYFDEMDVCLLWHPFGSNMNLGGSTSMALTSILFEYFGKSAHGAFAWDGRSALDACELMNIGVNYLREHMTLDCAVHYVYENGGEMPNVVPDYASVFYYIRSKDENHDALVERVKNIAKAAALMTETELKMTLRTHCHGNYPTISLNQYMYEESKLIPPLSYTEEEYDFARELYKNHYGKEAPEDLDALLPTKVLAPERWEEIPFNRGTSDVGDVSNILPTLQLGGLGELMGTPTHHWTTTVAAGTAIGEKAGIYASKLIAQGGLDLFKNPERLEIFWKEFREGREQKKIPPYQKCTFEI